MTDSGSAAAGPVAWRRTLVAAGIVALAAPLLIAWWTGQIWEDYYITFRSSRHLAEGHGLVYQLGERVHTFTSPLGTLLPALGFWLTSSDAAALWFFRVLGAAALSGAAVLTLAYARDRHWSPVTGWIAVILGVFEAKTVAFTANGMETGFLLLFAALTWREFSRPGGIRAGWLGIALAGLMWTRPDGCVLGAAMLAGIAIFGRGDSGLRDGRGIRPLSRALVLGGLLYAPWFVWAWSYYGSPIPQTIVAKSALTPEGLSFERLLAAPLRCLVSDTGIDGLFAPIYAHSGGWPRDLLNATRLLARLAAFLWLLPGVPRPARAASFAVLVGAVYFHQVMPYPWYYAPWTWLAALALVGAATALVERLRGAARSASRIAVGVIAVSSIALLAVQAHAWRIQQRVIEDGGRRQIGQWLQAHASSGDTVFLEPIGYIGYFSGLKILDFPGLTAPEVSGLVRAGHRDYDTLISRLQPTWLVLRPLDIVDQHLRPDGALRDYAVVKRWNQRPELEREPFLPGAGWPGADAEFILLRRRPGVAASASGSPR